MAPIDPLFFFIDNTGKPHILRVVDNYTSETGDYQAAFDDAVDANSGERLKHVPLRDMIPFSEAPKLDKANPIR